MGVLGAKAASRLFVMPCPSCIFALITEEDKGVVQSGVATSFPGFSPTCPGNEVEWSGC